MESGAPRVCGQLAVLVVTVLCLRPGSAAAGETCVRILSGLYQSEGCGVAESDGDRFGPRDRFAPRDRSAGRPFAAFDARTPRLAPPRFPTKDGPTTLADLNLVPDNRGGYRGSRPGFTFRIAEDGTVHFQDRPSIHLGGMLALGALGVFDLTDLVIRLQGGDPYNYDKSLVAALTRPMREAMTDEDRRRRLQTALRSLPRDLHLLWGRSDIDGRTRRALLFRIWDELVEGGDEPEALAAAQARGLIVRFIADKLPAGAADAYTDAELAELNAQRRSRARFAPYEAGR